MIRLRLVPLAGLLLLAAVPARAQMNPAAVGLGMVMPSAIRAQAGTRRRATRVRHVSEARARATCAEVPMFRARLGPHDPRVRKLAALCRQAGY